MDVFKQDGTPCGSNDRCYEGRCHSHEAQCKALFGKGKITHIRNQQIIPRGISSHLRNASSCMHQYGLGADLLERNSVEKDLGVPVISRVTMSQQCAPMADRANGVLVGQRLANG